MTINKKPKILTQEDLLRALRKMRKVVVKILKLQMTESLNNLTRNKLSIILNSKELKSHSHLLSKITWLCVGFDIQEL